MMLQVSQSVIKEKLMQRNGRIHRIHLGQKRDSPTSLSTKLTLKAGILQACRLIILKLDKQRQSTLSSLLSAKNALLASRNVTVTSWKIFLSIKQKIASLTLKKVDFLWVLVSAGRWRHQSLIRQHQALTMRHSIWILSHVRLKQLKKWSAEVLALIAKNNALFPTEASKKNTSEASHLVPRGMETVNKLKSKSDFQLLEIHKSSRFPGTTDS